VAPLLLRLLLGVRVWQVQQGAAVLLLHQVLLLLLLLLEQWVLGLGEGEQWRLAQLVHLPGHWPLAQPWLLLRQRRPWPAA
jgi:hypothetical protein